MPVLSLPPGTTIIIQEDRPDTMGATDLFEGRVETLGQQANSIEAVAPPWLAEVLFKVRLRRSARYLMLHSA